LRGQNAKLAKEVAAKKMLATSLKTQVRFRRPQSQQTWHTSDSQGKYGTHKTVKDCFMCAIFKTVKDCLMCAIFAGLDCLMRAIFS